MEDCMRILYLDLDTLRPDHLGCYGYHRKTSPNLDRIAAEGVRFNNCMVTDAPCLPSRAALHTGRFGIHTGVVNHGGTNADLRIEGEPRAFRNAPARAHWMTALKQRGFHTVSISPFAERHSAWWFYNGFAEMHNPGKGGNERADEVAPIALRWIDQNAKRDNWFLQVNFWDPHTLYRTPVEYGNPFANDPPPNWLTEEMRRAHYEDYGPHSAHEPPGWQMPNRLPRVPTEIASMADYRRWIDGYDVGIRYMDDFIGQVLDALDKQGVLNDTAILVSSDHGENQGELNVYGDHQTADYITSRVPLLIRWPGVKGGHVDNALHYQFDMAATVLELLGAPIPALWDGSSFAKAFRDGREEGRPYLVVSQCAWSCQRAVRFDHWILIRTYHEGLKNFPPVMLFDLARDPHETTNLADQRPDVTNRGLALLEAWTAEQMATSDHDADPLWTVMREGGPLHTRWAFFENYLKRLRDTGRTHLADRLWPQRAKYGVK